jgi:hypothetical protein
MEADRRFLEEVDVRLGIAEAAELGSLAAAKATGELANEFEALGFASA